MKDDGFIKITDLGTDELIAQALKYSDTLATPKESQMLFYITGVSINSKPRKDGRYQGYILRDGEKKYLYGKTPEEVAIKIKVYLKEAENFPKKKKKVHQSPLFKDYVNEWSEKYKKPNLKPKSYESLTYSLKHAINDFGEKPIGNITSDDLQEFFNGLGQTRTRDLCATYVGQVFEKAFDTGIIKRNPYKAVEIKASKGKKKKALTPEQQEKFLSSINGRAHSLLYRLLLSTGIRVGEALALYKTDFNFNKHTVIIDNDVVFIEGNRIEQENTKTEAGSRVLPVPEKLCNEIAKLPDGLLFPFSYNAVRQSLDRLSERLGFKVTAHLLRHTYNTRLEEAGIPPKVRQYLMGHAKLDMTMNTYTDVQEHYVESSTANVRNLFDI